MPIFRFFFREEKNIGDYVFTFAILPMMAIPAVMAANYGFRLLKEKSKKNIKGTIGAFAIFGTIFFGPWISSYFGGPEGSAGQISLLFGALCVIPCYVFVSNQLILGEGLIPTKGEFIGRKIVVLLTFQVWVVFSMLIDEFAPVKQGFTHVKETPWNFVGFIGSFLFAWIFYKLAMKFVVDSRKAQPLPLAAN